MEEISNKMKLLLIGIALIPIAIVIFFGGLIIVNAQERIQSIPLGYTATLAVGNNDTALIYNSNNNNFANWGRGYLSFSVAEYWTSTGTSTNMTTIREINVTSSGNIYTCQFGSVSMDYDYEENVKVASYSVICDVTMGENGLQQIRINHSNGLSNSIVVKTSDYMTFTDNLQIDTTQAINNVTTNMQNYLQTIINNQATYTQSINTTITNIVNSNFATLNSILNNGIDAINGRLDQIIENNLVCNIIDKENIKTQGKRLDLNGSEIGGNNDTDYGVTDYIKITKKTKIKMLVNTTSGTQLYNRVCFYNINKVYISCLQASNITINTEIQIPNNASYIRLTIEKNKNKPQYEICDTAQNITNQQNEQIINSDVDEETKQDVDKSDYNDYKDKEDELMDIASEADLTGLEIGIDRGTSSTIWQLITRIIQSNAKVFSLFISILSIGIIKIALAR